ncbi:hypothetical protein, partial [Rhodococcus phenolicus]|uniref:hypothetical protein n=1 Tax=Rhodococcus phenolicus TaxID=263849 RepID=UPI000AEA3445
MSRGPGVRQRQIQYAICKSINGGGCTFDECAVGEHKLDEDGDEYEYKFDECKSFEGYTHQSRWFTLNMCGLTSVASPRSERVSMARAVHRMEEQQILETTTTNPYDFPWLPRRAQDVVRGNVSPGRKLWFRPIPNEDVRVVEQALWVNDPDELSDDWDGTSIDRLPVSDVLRTTLIPWRYRSADDNELDAWAQYRRAERAFPAVLLEWIAFGTQGWVDPAGSVKWSSRSPRPAAPPRKRPGNLRDDQLDPKLPS